MTYPFASLPDNLAAFCAVLRRDHRFRIGPGDLQDAARALEITDLADERAVRDVLRPVLSGTLDDVRVFDRAFDQFFHGARGGLPDREDPGSSKGIARELLPPAAHARADARAASPDSAAADLTEDGGGTGSVRDVSDADGEAPIGVLRASYSPLEAEGAVPDLEPPDKAWRHAAAALVSRVRAGLSRRWRPAVRGQRFDFRRTLRSSLHTGGDVVTPRWRARPRRRPRFVLLVDGSRSMGAAARPALHAAVALTAVTLNTETFTFSTALRRVTRDVRRAAAGERRHLQLHHAWGGGTTIGRCLHEFLQRFAERLLGPDTVVIIASDGFDVGDPDLLRQAMARLSRRSAAIVWLNPFAETPGYEPTALGMSVARPFVTILTSVNDPAGLAKLSRAIRVSPNWC